MTIEIDGRTFSEMLVDEHPVKMFEKASVATGTTDRRQQRERRRFSEMLVDQQPKMNKTASVVTKTTIPVRRLSTAWPASSSSDDDGEMTSNSSRSTAVAVEAVVRNGSLSLCDIPRTVNEQQGEEQTRRAVEEEEKKNKKKNQRTFLTKATTATGLCCGAAFGGLFNFAGRVRWVGSYCCSRFRSDKR